LGIRIPAPSHTDVAQTLIQIARKESVQCSPEYAMKISQHSERNLRRALLMLESARAQIYPNTQLAPELPVVLPDWEMFITAMAREILQDQSPIKLLQVRDMLYELLTNCIPADVILTTLTREIMRQLDDTLKHEVSFWAAYYEHRICQGSKEIFHLEAFVAKFMAIYKRWLMEMFA
jgi:replication factor C subunit 3/5